MKVFEKRAFTLMEMSVTLVVMGMLTLVVAPFAANMRAAARHEQIRSAAAAIILAQKAFQVKNARGEFWCTASKTKTYSTQRTLEAKALADNLSLDFSVGKEAGNDLSLYTGDIAFTCDSDKRKISIGLTDGDQLFCLKWDGSNLTEYADHDDGTCPSP